MRETLLLTLDFPPSFIGGISAWSCDLAQALHASGRRVTVVAKHCGDTQAHDESQPFEIVRARGRSWSRWQALWMRLAAQRMVTDDTLVLSATWRLAPHMLTTVKSRNAALAVAFHGSELTTLEAAPKKLRSVVNAATVLFPVSSFLAGELVRLGCIEPDDPRVHVLPMPLAVDANVNTDRSEDLICVARPLATKRIDRAIQIARVTGRQLHLVGPSSGPDGTIAHGPLSRPETLRLISKSSAIILTPSTDSNGRGGEGLGLVLLEAAARGVPAIGCSTGGVPEALGPGLLLTEPDAPDGDQINLWLANRNNGELARQWVQANHGPDHCLSVLAGVRL